MLGSRTDGALEEETSWPNGTWTFFTSCLVAGCLAITLCGCSAVTALAETRRAERALTSTQGLRPTPAAVHALTMSRAYLEKAREEASEAQYGRSVFYAQAARRAAEDAQRTQVQHVSAGAAPAARQSEVRK